MTQSFDLAAAAHAEMLRQGFHPDFTPAIAQQVEQVRTTADARTQTPGMQDLRKLLWSSIDNDTSRDLDQIEWAERTAEGIRVLVGIADVDAAMPKDSPLDKHAAQETTSVYTPAAVFPMLPEAMSTDLTSLNEGQDRLAIVIEYTVSNATPDSVCDVASLLLHPKIYRALVQNRAQLAYNSVGAWLEGRADAPEKVAASADLQQQLRLQDEAAQTLRRHRVLCGALEFERPEAQANAQASGKITDIVAQSRTRANDLIEDFMIASNEVMARTLLQAGRSSIRRVVRTPKRWDRIVAVAAEKSVTLPAEPDSGALNKFLIDQKAADPVHYPDLSLTIIKLMGPGIYVLTNAGQDQEHFGLAAHDYTHSTAPNRRFPDVITQRCMKAMITNADAPYSDGDLAALADHCTAMEDSARKVERTTLKMAAALALQSHVGQQYAAVVTGASDKGVYVRIANPPVEGRLMQNEKGLSVGDQVQVELLHTNPQRGFIDFAALRN